MGSGPERDVEDALSLYNRRNLVLTASGLLLPTGFSLVEMVQASERVGSAVCSTRALK